MTAAAVRPPLSWARNACDIALPELVDEGRHAFALELDIPLSVARPPVIRAKDAHGDPDVYIPEGARLGYTLSAQLTTRLRAPTSYGNTFPMARALDDLRGWCRGRHLEGSAGPWEDHAADVELLPDLQRPLCARLAWAVIAWRMTPAWAARQEKLPVMRGSRLLTVALQHTYEKRREWAQPGAQAVAEVLASIRRERRAARERAAAAGSGTECRYCGEAYDSASQEPCSATPAVAAIAAAFPGEALLCAPQ